MDNCKFVCDGLEFPFRREKFGECFEFFRAGAGFEVADTIEVDCSPAAVGFVVDFVYGSKLSIMHNTVDEVLDLVDYLLIRPEPKQLIYDALLRALVPEKCGGPYRLLRAVMPDCWSSPIALTAVRTRFTGEAIMRVMDEIICERGFNLRLMKVVPWDSWYQFYCLCSEKCRDILRKPTGFFENLNATVGEFEELYDIEVNRFFDGKTNMIRYRNYDTMLTAFSSGTRNRNKYVFLLSLKEFEIE